MKSILEHYIEWMTSEIQVINTYHDHKEKMAWTATAFYVPATVILGYTAADHLDDIAKLVLSVLIVVASVMTTMFVNMQFRMRWVAADMEKGLKRIKGKLCQLEEMSPSFNLSLPEGKANEIPPQWPIFVQQELDKCVTKRFRADIPKAILNTIIFRWKKIDDRHKTEVASYCAIVFATFIAVSSLWILDCR
jgi:hypothetical protein